MTSAFRSAASALGFSFALVCLAGCSDAPFPTYPVKGKVTMEDGSKLPGDIRRIFFYAKGNEPRSPQGMIAPDGTYTLGSTEPGDGAPEGEFTVVFSCINDADYRKGAVKELINPKYSSAKTSPITVKVPGGVYDFKVPK